MLLDKGHLSVMLFDSSMVQMIRLVVELLQVLQGEEYHPCSWLVLPWPSANNVVYRTLLLLQKVNIIRIEHLAQTLVYALFHN